MADVPKTRLPAPVEEAERLRDFVRAAELMNGRIAGARVARTGDAAALAGLLAHESIGPRIYTMPNPINAETMTAFIADHLEQRERGGHPVCVIQCRGGGDGLFRCRAMAAMVGRKVRRRGEGGAAGAWIWRCVRAGGGGVVFRSAGCPADLRDDGRGQ